MRRAELYPHGLPACSHRLPVIWKLDHTSSRQKSEKRKFPSWTSPIMLQLTFPPRYQLETSYRFAGSALPLIASMSPSTTGKECRDHRREPDVVRSRTKSTGIDYQSSGRRRALEDLLARSCRRVCVVCTFELYGSCGRVWLACTLHICTRPTMGATRLTAPDADSPNGMQRTGSGRVPIAAAVVLVQASTWVDHGVGNQR